jgi:hypothetical protein
MRARRIGLPRVEINRETALLVLDRSAEAKEIYFLGKHKLLDSGISIAAAIRQDFAVTPRLGSDHPEMTDIKARLPKVKPSLPKYSITFFQCRWNAAPDRPVAPNPGAIPSPIRPLPRWRPRCAPNGSKSVNKSTWSLRLLKAGACYLILSSR